MMGKVDLKNDEFDFKRLKLVSKIMKLVFKMMKLVFKTQKLLSPAFSLQVLGWIPHKKIACNTNFIFLVWVYHTSKYEARIMVAKD